MSSKPVNDITIFSNGIGHFRRSYRIAADKEKTLSIPFKRDHIGDVASSLQVMGRVRLTKPPSFTPSNANATALKIAQGHAYKSLAKSLSGARVSVRFGGSQAVSCTLVGLDSEDARAGDNVVKQDYIVLLCDGQFLRRPLFEITGLTFEEDAVRTEIDKALKNNFQEIKPDSTLLELSLAAADTSEQEAVVQYTIPVAAWKMRYAIRQEGDSFLMEGAAVIDNNTDEDWDNFRVSVVTGNPVTFETDIADVCVPVRKRLNIADPQAAGHNADDVVRVAMSSFSGTVTSGCVGSGQTGMFNVCSGSVAKFSMATANTCQFGLEAAAGGASAPMPAAETAGVEAMDVGDFCVFTSKDPITILARKSAVVPMFSVPLTKAGVVLHYKETHNARRPYRAVKFKNETSYSLGRGKTLVYNNGVFSGECVLGMTKPGDSQMLPHCLENGVRIVKDVKPVETRRHSLRIGEGVGVAEEAHTAVVTYAIDNFKDEPFKVALDHIYSLRGHANLNIDYAGVEIREKEKLGCGDATRLYFEVKPKQKLTITVTEHSLSSQRTVIGGYYSWLKNNVIDVENPLCKNKQVRACVEVQEKIDGVNYDLNEKKAKLTELTEQGNRVRQNLGATHAFSGMAAVAEWVADLDATERDIRELTTKSIPALQKKLRELQMQLTEEIKKISASWTEKQ